MIDPALGEDPEGVRAGIEDALKAHLAEERKLYGSIGGRDAAVLADAVESILERGKRLRPSFCYWSYRAHGGEQGTREAAGVLRVGAALELFQAAALFHDDVMDSSDTRRGRPTAHRSFAARHAREGWTGDAGRFGESAAILLGDLALTASESQFASALAAFADGPAAAARRVFDLMRTEVTVGQYLDVLAQALPWGVDPAADEARAREVVRAKSARYSVEHPVALGAALAGADEAALATAREFGLPLGEAFQLRDDMLGVFGDPGVTGKPAGDDLREGKRTVLVARAMSLAPPPERELLASLLGNPDLGEDDVERLATVLEGCGAASEVESLIDELTARALEQLDAANLGEPGAAMLRRLARAAVDRAA